VHFFIISPLSFLLENNLDHRHGFIPLGEVIDCNDDVFVFIVGWRVASHEVYAPFSKGVDSNEWVEKRGHFSCFVGI
jgi:hypothetical protein